MYALERYGRWRARVVGGVMTGFALAAVVTVLGTVTLFVSLLGGGPGFLLVGAGVLAGTAVLGLGAFVSRRVVRLRGPAKLRALSVAHDVPIHTLEATTSASEQL